MSKDTPQHEPSLSLRYLAKPIHEVSIADVASFFLRERSETDQLEFKSINPNSRIDDQLPSIRKTVCAFLNSSGGLLIWGAPRGVKLEGKKEKVFAGDPTFFDFAIEKDYLVSKIVDGIIPLPNGLKVNPLIDENRSLVIIEVQSSDYSPHQCSDDVYYMRIDGQTRHAPHHYIEALFRKIRFPDIRCYLKLDSINRQNTGYLFQLSLSFVNISSFQNDEKLSFIIRSSMRIRRTMISWLSEIREDNARDIVYFNDPVTITFYVAITDSEMESISEKSIIIVFGGKYSPRKISKYALRLDHLGSLSYKSFLENHEGILPIIKDVLLKDTHEDGITEGNLSRNLGL